MSIMALIKTSALVSEISGKVGGNVFARNRGGSYVRKFAVPLNPKTPAQSKQRSRLAFVSNAWKSLSAADKEGWAAAALLAFRRVTNRLGESTSLTPPQYYIKANLLRLAALPSSPLLEQAPVPVVYPGITLTDANVDFASSSVIVNFTVADGYDSLGYYYTFKMTKPTPAGQTPRSFRNIGTYSGTSPLISVTGQDVTLTIPFADVEAIVGNLNISLFHRGILAPLDPDDPWDTISENFAVDNT